MQELTFEGHPSLQVTASFGITWTDAERRVDTFEELIAEADRALYAAKRAGRNCVVAFDELEPPRPRELAASAGPG